ncbi:hypothetical protein H5U53_23470 [Escherichia coli]|uniref:Uncharacterized protein n=1 Tax=Escherichia coli TaxID=562 RepID=A0A6D0XTU1_ECOLX|nr:hypothetical protein [Escherichia coli]EEV7050336.1 hypothetical protein [Escherichia coli]EHL6065889.1 ESPR domain-containing protein [Escherichia coli]EIJ0857695.1 ESPR domain-containing protein [Escherichia coli]EIO7610810.1 ESPR domain-containing protein [Escherichia coli]
MNKIFSLKFSVKTGGLIAVSELSRKCRINEKEGVSFFHFC